MTRFRPIACAAALVLVTSAAACSADAGPLVYGDPSGSHSAVCAPAQPGEQYLIGDSVGPSDEDVRIDSVELVDPSGISLIDTWLLPVGDQGIGTDQDPPVDFPAWESRVPAVGATVAAGDLTPIAFEVERTGDDPGEATAVTIHYTAHGVGFQRTGTLSIELATPCGGSGGGPAS